MLVVTKTAESIEQGFENLKEVAIQDYKAFIDNERMQSEYADGLRLEGGNKYIKVTMASGSQRSVWGFIVKEDTGKFRKGDLLKAASWKAPALNMARGNVLDGNYPLQWTGPMYLR